MLLVAGPAEHRTQSSPWAEERNRSSVKEETAYTDGVTGDYMLVLHVRYMAITRQEFLKGAGICAVSTSTCPMCRIGDDYSKNFERVQTTVHGGGGVSATLIPAMMLNDNFIKLVWYHNTIHARAGARQ